MDSKAKNRAIAEYFGHVNRARRYAKGSTCSSYQNFEVEGEYVIARWPAYDASPHAFVQLLEELAESPITEVKITTVAESRSFLARLAVLDDPTRRYCNWISDDSKLALRNAAYKWIEATR